MVGWGSGGPALCQGRSLGLHAQANELWRQTSFRPVRPPRTGVSESPARSASGSDCNFCRAQAEVFDGFNLRVCPFFEDGEISGKARYL